MPTLTKLFLLTALAASVAVPSRAQDRVDTQRSGNERVTINASEVQVDLVVKDKKFRPVKDLEPGDLEVYEDGVRQDLKSLRLVNGEAAGGADTARPAGAANGTPAQASGPALRGNAVALVFDRLSPGARKLA